MKRRWILVCSMVFVMAITFNTTAYSGNGNGSRSGSGQTYYADLDDAEKATLQFMREEEKLARDVYLDMYDKWQMTIFLNIASSEQRHMDAIKRMLDKYGLEDPVKEKEGEFSNADLLALYGDLIDQGSESLSEALRVGATIEDLDIFDLNEAILETDNLDLQQVYTNLRKGSENHLRAFVGELENLDETYEPQYISQQEFDDIIAASNEKGRGKRKGETQK